jgi:hypothetical protein
MPSQNPSDVRGKILRVDVNPNLPNSYQGIDANKNFNIPASNPIPTYLSAHPGTLRGPGNTAPLGEVYVTGLRNGYRVSFDRANGNMYLGDVGETTVEEVDFLKAGTNTGTNPPVDFGWPQREGTTASSTNPMDASLGYPASTTNPFTGVVQLNPIQQFLHNMVSRAVIGGYVYRGPVASLQGQYFYSDFVQGTVLSLAFDPGTDPNTFNGNNGTLTDDTSLFKSLLGKPSGGLGTSRPTAKTIAATCSSSISAATPATVASTTRPANTHPRAPARSSRFCPSPSRQRSFCSSLARACLSF